MIVPHKQLGGPGFKSSMRCIWLSLQWLHNEREYVSSHQRLGGLFTRLFRRRSKKTSKVRVTGLCVGNSPVTGEFPTQRVSYAENVSIWWRHHEMQNEICMGYGSSNLFIDLEDEHCLIRFNWLEIVFDFRQLVRVSNTALKTWSYNSCES